jgi:hypothetical protein
MRSDLPQGKERDERDETRRHPLFASRGIIEETGVEFLGLADQLLAADLRRSAIEDARVRGLLGDGPFRHAFEIALAIDRERPVVFQAELRLDRRPGARLFSQILRQGGAIPARR